MTQKVLVRSPPVNHRQTVFTNETPREKRRVGEMAGGAAAECTAVCCCCPLTVMNLLVLAVYKVPAGLCKKAIHKRKRKRLKKMKIDVILQQRVNAGASDIENVQSTLEDHTSAETKKETGVAEKVEGVSNAGELEKEMWAQFSGAGFWRSHSQREPQSPGV